MRPTHKILAVDDSRLNLEILEEIFGGSFRLELAASGLEAIRIAKRFKPGIVFLDVMMPGMDGLETCRQLRRIPELSQSYIVMVSAKAMPSEQEAGIRAGADDYITKPFDETELIELVRRYDDPEARSSECRVIGTDDQIN